VKHKYAVRLTDTERVHVQTVITAGTAPARQLMHARILPKADQGRQGPAWTDEAITQAVEVSQPTLFRVRRHYVEQGLQAALDRRPPTREDQRTLDGVQEAHLVALACGSPPQGQGRWSLRLLADKLVELEVAEDISYQTVRRVRKTTR
jgi:hypothetical protein